MDAAQIDLVAAVHDALAEAYAEPIVVQQEDARVAVLAGKPLELARRVVAEVHGPAFAQRVVAIDVATLPRYAVPEAGLRLWRQHGRSGVDGELVTELEGGDPAVQVVVERDGWLLVRLVDGAQGWARVDELPCDAIAPVPALRDVSQLDVEAFLAAVEAFEGVPYVWGGTTDAGVDCSGMVQRAAWRAGGCWLPRHSRALLQVGERVAPSAVSRGDVLVLQRSRADDVHPMHVAVARSADEVVHASRDALRVVREPLDSLRERYRVLGVRRLGPAR